MSSDWTKSGLCILAALVWAPIAVRFAPNTPVGVAIILVPFGGLALAGAFFYVRGRWKDLL